MLYIKYYTYKEEGRVGLNEGMKEGRREGWREGGRKEGIERERKKGQSSHAILSLKPQNF